MQGRHEICGGFPKSGVRFGGFYNKDYSILGFILGFPNFGQLPHVFLLDTLGVPLWGEGLGVSDFRGVVHMFVGHRLRHSRHPRPVCVHQGAQKVG